MPDGASASLVGVLVRDVNPDGSFTVRESWSDAFTLTVIPTEPVEITPLQTVDVSGIIQITVNGGLHVNASTVKVYTDAAGSIISTPLPVRTENGAVLPWQWKDEAAPAATLAPSGMMSSMNSPPPPGGSGQNQPPASIPVAGTIAYAKTVVPGGNVTLNGKVLTRKFPAAGYFYIQEPQPKREGIRVVGSTTHEPGTLLDVSGVVQLAADGEKQITSPTIAQCTECIGAAEPVTVINRTLNFEDLVVEETGFDLALGATGGHGTNLAGTLVRTAGRVTAADAASPKAWFEIKDGSLADAVRVVAPGGITQPLSVDDYFKVTGIAGLSYTGLKYDPILRLADVEDDLVNPQNGSTLDELTFFSTLITYCN